MKPTRVTAAVCFYVLLCVLVGPSTATADVELPSIFGDHMVLQRDAPVPVWGRADPGEGVTVSIDDQTHTTRANGEGKWTVKLRPLAVGAPRSLTVKGKNTIRLDDVLVGEVWICSGQSNMGMAVRGCWNADLEIAGANYGQIRLLTVDPLGSQTPVTDFKGRWQVCSPETVPDFSAVGFFFGRQLHRVLGVPVGLIDNAWGGSACEAWIRRDLLEGKELYAPLLERWAKIEAEFDMAKAEADYKTRLERWQRRRKQALDAGKPAPRRPRRPRRPRNPLTGQHRPANLYNGRLKPVLPFAIRGVIWYQGEANAGRAYQYRDMFPLMVKNWRDDWGQGDFPFYWVQLADFKAEQPEPQESAWAELREAQTLAMKRLPRSGQAVIIDLGEGSDIHPKNKQDVAARLARWALAKEYGRDLVYSSPVYKAMEKQGAKVAVSFDHVGGGLRTVDRREVVGFAIAGEDHKWRWAQAKIVGKDRVEVWSDEVPNPVAVRYAWADNPVCNLYSRAGLPVTPFRTDDWPGVTASAR